MQNRFACEPPQRQPAEPLPVSYIPSSYGLQMLSLAQGLIMSSSCGTRQVVPSLSNPTGPDSVSVYSGPSLHYTHYSRLCPTSLTGSPLHPAEQPLPESCETEKGRAKKALQRTSDPTRSKLRETISSKPKCLSCFVRPCESKCMSRLRVCV